MFEHVDFRQGQQLLLERVRPIGIEAVPLTECYGRLLAQDLRARENIPPFDRSPYDGYAFQSADTQNACKDCPTVLKILEEIPAGAVPSQPVIPGTAVKILTGAPIPSGADAVCKFEDTEFTKQTVSLFSPVKPGSNIVRIGEDVKQGQLLAQVGRRIDEGTAGTIASQGLTHVKVHRIPKVGILSTGNEVIEADAPLAPGKIRNSNRHTLEAALLRYGFEPVYLGLAGDSIDSIASAFQEGLDVCDAVISTGGVSVGDYDLTPEAMERAGTELLFLGSDLKPGMACAYGIKEGKPVCALSGNPASSMVSFYAITLPVLRKLSGACGPWYEEIPVKVLNGFPKKSPVTRLLRGRLVLSEGIVAMDLPKDQGNVVLSSSIGCNIMAIVPAGSGPVEPNTILKGFLL